MIEQIVPKWSDNGKRFDLIQFGLSVGAGTLAAWLSNDVSSKAVALDFIAKFEALDRSTGGGYLGTGNSYNVMAANGFIFLETEYDDEPKVLLRIDDAITMLRTYMTFMEDARRGRELPPEPLHITYEMTGEPALEYYLATGFSMGLSADELEWD